MEALRLPAVAARVVAWHNRHPLARRITAAQVHGLGYVALPFGQPPASTKPWLQPLLVLIKTWPLLASKARLQPAFTEDFIPPLPRRQVARWVAGNGRVLVQAPDDAPVRDVPLATEVQGHASTVYVMTATVDLGTLRTRVLIGADHGFGRPAQVLGPRLWSGARLSIAATAVLLMGTAAALLGWLQPAEGAAPLALKPAGLITETAAQAGLARPKLGPAALATSAPASAASAEPVSALRNTSAWSASIAASAPAPAYLPLLASLPPAADAQLGRVQLPTLGGLISEEAKAAARAQRLGAAQVKPAVGSASAPPSTVPSSTSPPASTMGGVPAALPTTAIAARRAAIFALTTRPLRTRAEAEQVMAAMGALLRTGAAMQKLDSATKMQTDILAEGEDWRVVGMPFAKRDDAEQARKLLVARGMRVDVVDF
jgi:hypothetical protein